MSRLAVIGAGVMGSNHARVAKSHRDWDLVAVVDADLAKATATADAAGAKAFADIATMLANVDVDAAVVAVPTAFHVEATLQLLRAGVHVLVEKPIAPAPADATLLADAAAQAGRTLMVGHIERFNAAVRALSEIREVPIHIEASRIGPFSARVADSVIADLMIHDLDIVANLAGAEVTAVSAVAQSRRSTVADLAVASLRFSNGTTATCTASRLGQQKIREIRVTYSDSFVVADLIRQDVAVNRVTHTEFLADDGARYRQSGVVEIPYLDRVEPLAAELSEFNAAVTLGRAPLVDATDGRRALELVRRVEDAARTGSIT